MVLGTILTLAYLAVAFSAAMMTLWEQKRRQTHPVLRLAGFALCMIWPLTVVAMLVAIQLGRFPRRPHGPDDMTHASAVKAH